MTAAFLAGHFGETEELLHRLVPLGACLRCADDFFRAGFDGYSAVRCQHWKASDALRRLLSKPVAELERRYPWVRRAKRAKRLARRLHAEAARAAEESP